MVKLVGGVALFAAGLALAGGLAATGVADVTTTETLPVTTTVEETTTAPATTVVTTEEQTTLAPASPTTTSSSSSSSTPTWAWIVIAILGAAVVGLLVAVFSRDRGGPPGPPTGPP